MKFSLHKSAWLVLGLILFSTVRAEQAVPAATPPLDTPCKVHQKTAAIYPVRLLNQGVMRGEAQIVAEVDHKGKLGDLLVAAYTHQEFAQEAVTAIKKWAFEPGYINGAPVTSILTIIFEFEVSGVLVHEVSMESRARDRFDHSHVYHPHGIATLDRKPARLNGEEPIYPKAWIQEGRAGSVNVEFFIDEDGRARLPAISAQDDSFLAASALAAVKTWRFEPPTHRGKPVLVRAEQLFVFRPPGKSSRDNSG